MDSALSVAFDHNDFLELIGVQKKVQSVWPEKKVDLPRRVPLPACGVPPEVYSRIFSFLDIECYPNQISYLFQLQLVSREWREIILNTPVLWKNIVIGSNARQSGSYLAHCLARSKAVPLTIHIQCEKEIVSTIQQLLLSNAGKIGKIFSDDQYCHFDSSQFYQTLVTASTNLETLVAGATTFGLDRAPPGSLKTLILCDQSFGIAGPNVEVLEFRFVSRTSCTDVQQFLDGLPQRFCNITSLTLPYVYFKSDALPKRLSYQFPRLTKLSSVTDRCVVPILRGSASTIVELSTRLEILTHPIPTLPNLSLMRLFCWNGSWSKGDAKDYRAHQEIISKFPSLTKLLLLIHHPISPVAVEWFHSFLWALISCQARKHPLSELEVATIDRGSSRIWTNRNGKGYYRRIGSEEEHERALPMPEELLADINWAMGCV
jgi:hypothetical protein